MANELLDRDAQASNRKDRHPPPSGELSRALTSIRQRKARLAREIRLTKSRMALLRARYARDEVLLACKGDLQACQEELARLCVQETETLLEIRRWGEPPESMVV